MFSLSRSTAAESGKSPSGPIKTTIFGALAALCCVAGFEAALAFWPTGDVSVIVFFGLPAILGLVDGRRTFRSGSVMFWNMMGLTSILLAYFLIRGFVFPPYGHEAPGYLPFLCTFWMAGSYLTGAGLVDATHHFKRRRSRS